MSLHRYKKSPPAATSGDIFKNVRSKFSSLSAEVQQLIHVLHLMRPASLAKSLITTLAISGILPMAVAGWLIGKMGLRHD